MSAVDSKQFLRDVKTLKDFPPIVLFLGEEESLVSEALKALTASFIAKYGDANPDFNRETLHADRDGAEKILDACGTLPFGSEKKLVVVRHLEKLPDSGREELATYAASPNPSTCMVLLWGTRPGQSTLGHALSEAATAKGVLVKFWKLFEDQRPIWIREELAKRGKRSSADAAQLLADQGGESLAELSSEIEKIVLYTGTRAEVTLEDVKETMSFRRNQSVWDLSDKLEKGSLREAGRILEHCLEQGEEPIFLLNMIARSCRKLSEQAPKKPQRAELARMFDEIKKTDLMLKSGHGIETAAFERLLGLCGSVFFSKAAR